MKNLASFGIGAVLALALTFGVMATASSLNPLQGPMYALPAQFVAALTRPCIYQPGAATLIACTGTGVAAESTSLHQWSSYYMQCAQNSYYRTGTTATQATPTTGDLYLPAGSIQRLPTTDTMTFIGCLPQATQAGCVIQECL